jgi:hypothetical protein
MEARLEPRAERLVKYRPSLACFNQEASEARVNTLPRARHPLELQEQAQSYYALVDVAPASGRIQLGRRKTAAVTPSAALLFVSSTDQGGGNDEGAFTYEMPADNKPSR